MDHLAVKDALPVFYQNYDLQPDGGIHEPTVKIMLYKGIYIYIPNFKARKKVVLKHDIHHLVTGYEGVMKGETEISAWELSTGCTNNWVAFTINTYGMMLGVLFNIKGLWKAWSRGKRTRNLYHEKYKEADLLNQSVEEIKKELGLFEENNQERSSLTVFFTFSGFLIFGSIFSAASIVLIPILLIYSLSIAMRNRWRKS